ncbi:extracellular solute-binding protein [Streptomyces tirandamycinicus]|uniref:extracellular solute-binding protein n=1 Tax=Streptomyces tirandamycinicus TaxID=2174846 RepID=UPI00226F1964|nr:extracellular solute-binding protein [Streptomyces tirandamycinicus]MCY0983693.1 extracellular solute-binding protein [Streptomyces tirandamycinicus]
MSAKTVIDVWVADLTFPGYMDRLHKLGAEFEKAHPEYTINIEGRDFRMLSQQIAEAADEGRPPAVAEYYFAVTQAARDSRTRDGRPLFTSVQKAIAGRTEILGEPVVVDDLIPAVREYYSVDGDLASMPAVVTAMLIYGNKTALDKAGVSSLPTTWGEIEAACEAVAALEGGPSHGVTWANHGLFFQQALAAQNGELADNANGRAGRATRLDLSSGEMLTWAEWWRELHRKGHYLYTGKIPDWEGNIKAFADQAVALRITSSNDLNYMAMAAENAGFEMSVGRFPQRDGEPNGGNIIAGTSLWLADGLDEATQDGALAFMQFLNNPRNAADRHIASSFVPVTRSSYRLLEEEGWFDAHPYHRLASRQLGSYPEGGGEGVPPCRGALFGDFAGAQDVMTRAMDDVLLRDAAPAQRFAEATAEAQALLDAYEEDRVGNGVRNAESLRVEYFRDAEAYTGAQLEDAVKGTKE